MSALTAAPRHHWGLDWWQVPFTCLLAGSLTHVAADGSTASSWTCVQGCQTGHVETLQVDAQRTGIRRPEETPKSCSNSAGMLVSASGHGCKFRLD